MFEPSEENNWNTFDICALQFSLVLQIVLLVFCVRRQNICSVLRMCSINGYLELGTNKTLLENLTGFAIMTDVVNAKFIFLIM